jgi:glutaredoxin
MKKIFLIILLLALLELGSALLPVFAQHKDIDIYFFKSDACPYCKRMGEIIAAAVQENPALKVHEYEIVSSEKGRKLLAELVKAYRVDITGVPVVFIGEEVTRGLDEEQFKNALTVCQEKGCASPTDKIDQEVLKSILTEEENTTTEVQTNHNYIGWIIAGGIAVLVIFTFIFAGVRRGSSKDATMQS